MSRRSKRNRPNTDVAEHFHPRWLAREIARNQLKADGYERLNRPMRGKEGMDRRSTFARMWREAASHALKKKWPKRMTIPVKP